MTDAKRLKATACCFSMVVTLSHKIPSIRDIGSCSIRTASSRYVMMPCKARGMTREVIFGLLHLSSPNLRFSFRYRARRQTRRKAVPAFFSQHGFFESLYKGVTQIKTYKLAEFGSTGLNGRFKAKDWINPEVVLQQTQ